jgi:hypothetical protein
MLIATTSFSQIFVDHSRKQVDNLLNHEFKNNKVIVTKTDTNLIYLLRDLTLKHLDLYFSFDKDKNCTFQKVSFDCDTCYRKWLKNTMKTAFMDWKSIAPGRYVSRDWLHLLLVTNDEKLFYTITLVHYTRDEYKQLFIKNKPDKNKPEVYY